jgi:hypothetical protein
MLDRLFHRPDFRFFDFFARHAALMVMAAKEFLALAETGENIAGRARRIKEIEHEADVATHQCVELLRRGATDTNAFAEVARRHNGREPMHLLRLPDDRVQVLSWPGLPSLWTVTTGAVPSLAGPTPIPGGWMTLAGSSTPYSGAGIGPSGHLCFVASRGDARTMPGALYTADSAWDFACRNPGGAWTPFSTLPFGLRYAYPFVMPAAAGDCELVATRDILWEAAGYTPPAGAFGYVFNAVDHWTFPNITTVTPARQELGRLEPGPGTNVVSFTVGDAMRDHLGRLHVLTRSRTSGGVWKMGHVLVGPGGALTRADVNVAGYTDGSIRLVQDDFDRFVLLFFQSGNTYAYPATDADGLVLGQRTDLTSTFIRPGITRQGHVYVAAPRGGTVPGRFVDLLMDFTATGGAAQIAYARIQLY